MTGHRRRRTQPPGQVPDIILLVLACTALALVAIVALSGCGNHPAATASHPARVVPAGCGRALITVSAVQGQLEQAPGDAAFNSMDKQLNGLADQLPHGSLRLDVLWLVVAIDRFNYDMLTGQDSGTDAGGIVRAEAKIRKECRP